MQFNTPWKTYDEAELDRHATGAMDVPVIYIAHDRSCVLIERTDPTGGSVIEIAKDDQITELWDQLQITALLSVLRVVELPPLNLKTQRPTAAQG